jgi:hypothetical protein
MAVAASQAPLPRAPDTTAMENAPLLLVAIVFGPIFR